MPVVGKKVTNLLMLNANGPMSIRALANDLGRDHKDVHTDVRRLENVGLIGRKKMIASLFPVTLWKPVFCWRHDRLSNRKWIRSKHNVTKIRNVAKTIPAGL
jgi:hypothetical protein